MDKKSLIVLVLGLAVTVIILIFNIYLAGVVFILVITLFMSLQIMQDSVFHPNVEATLSDDAKSIILKNSGNSTALHIHVALVPRNTEFDVPSIAVDESYNYPLGSMVEEIKVVVTFENEKNNVFSKSYALSSLGKAYDPLKPMIPMFKLE